MLTTRLFLTIPLAILLLCTGCSGHAPDESFEIATKGIYGAAIDRSGKFAAIGSIHHGGSLWEIDANKRLANWNHKKEGFTQIVATDFSPEGDYAITASPQTLVLWETNTGNSLTFWTTPGQILDVALGPNGNHALLGLTDHTAVIFDVKRGGVRQTFYHKNRVRSVSLSADGKLALTGSEDGTVKLWDAQTGKELQMVQHNNDVQLVEISANGRLAFSVSKYDKAILWDTSTGNLIGEIPINDFAIERGQSITAAAFSSNGQTLLTGSTNKSIRLWNTNDQSTLQHWSLPTRDYWRPTAATVISVNFGNNGNYYAISSNGYVHRLSEQ